MNPVKGDIWKYEGGGTTVTVLILTDPVFYPVGDAYWAFKGLPLDSDQFDMVEEWALRLEMKGWRKIA